MATASEEALRAIFEQIRDERKTHANTATRIGDAFLSLLSHLDNGTFLKQGDTESTEYILSVTGGASASLTKLFTLETVTEQGEERVTLATPLAPFKELELRDYLQIGDARLRWDSERQALYVIGKDGSTPVGFYSTGWISAKGANDSQGEGGGGGLSYSRLDTWEGYSDEEKGGWVLSAYLGVRLHQDIENLKSGVAMSYAVTGTGNAMTDVTRDGSRWVFTKGKTFSELGHTHTLSTISDLHANWDAILKVAPSAYVTRWPTAAEVGALTQTTADSRYAQKTVTISAGAGLTGGGNLSANRTLSLAAVGTAGTYTKVTVDAYGRVTAHASLSAADIPSLSISKISGLQSALDKKLEATAFTELFEKVTLADGTTAIRAKYGLYTDSFLSAKGANPNQGEGGGGGLSYSRLDSWEGYSDEEKGGWVLSAYLGYRLYKDINDLKSGVAMSYAVQGTGNAITDVTRDSSRWVFTKDKTFSELGHTHKLSDISNLNSSWDSLLKEAPSAYVTRWPSWSEVDGKPSTFTPSSHKHTKSQITDFPTTWAWSAISGKPTTFTPSAHQHPLSDISDLHSSWDAILKAAPFAGVSRWPSWGEVTGKPTSFTPSSHTHAISQVTGLQSALDAKLPAATFEELFEKVTLASGETAIRAKLGLYSDKWLSAKGANPNQGEGGGFAYTRLDTWEGYDSATMDGWVLSAKLGYSLYNDVKSLKAGAAVSFTIEGTGNAITDISKNGTQLVFTRGMTFALSSHQHLLSNISDLNSGWRTLLKAAPSAYVTRWPSFSEVTSKPTTLGGYGITDAAAKGHTHSQYLTAHQAIYSLTLQGNGTTLGTYTPNSKALTINITPSSIGAATSSHTHSQYLTGITKSMVEAVLTGNITSHTHSQYLTSHQAIYALTVKAGSTSVLSFNPKTAAATLTLAAGSGISLSADTTNKKITITGTYKYTHPSATATTIGAATGKVLSAITVNSLGHVTSVAAKTLAAADIPTLAISKISGLQSSLDSKLAKATFDDLFEKVTLSDGTVAIHAKYGFYSDGFVSGKGANPSAGEGGGTAYNRLDTWEGYTDELATWVLSAGLGHSLYNDVQSLKRGAAVSFTIQGSGNAVTDVSKSGTSLTFTKGLAFLTSHQNIYALTIQGNGTAIDKYTPNSAAKTINITPANIGAATSGHTHSQYLTSVSLATISDLHSSWDSVLKAQKPAWLTAVSLATISDLHSSWDALLKAAPSAYVTRWPSIGEVTGKQSLAIKLNGGGTEGTNLFTYNGTAAKTVNITASSIGAAASSHSHSYLPLSGGTMNAGAQIKEATINCAWYQGRDRALIRSTQSVSGDNYYPLWSSKSLNGSWECGTFQSNALFISYITDTNYSNKNNSVSAQFKFGADGVLTSKTFAGNLAWSYITGKPTSFTPSSHTHTISQITDRASLFTAFTANGNNTRITIGGTTKDLTVPYATNADKLDGLQATSFMRCDGANGIALTGGNGNTAGYRLVIQKTMPGWSINNLVFVVASRHNGQGILSVAFHITAESPSSYRYSIRYFGANFAMTAPFRAFYNTSTHVFRLYWHYVDYTSTAINVLRVEGFPSPSNGTWYEAMPSDNGTELTIECNNADTLGGTSKGGLLTALSSSTGTNLSLTVGGTTKTVADLYATAAEKLLTARTINGTSFNGTANIVTSYWGTARNIAIASSNGGGAGTATSVNGSANVTLKLPATITAALSGNASTASKLQTARTLWGRSFDGSANVSGDLSGVGNISASGVFSTSKVTNTHLAGNQGQALVNSTASAGAYVMLHRGCSTNGYFTMGTWGQRYCLFYTARSVVTAGSNNYTKMLTLLDEGGNTTFPGTVNAALLHATTGIYSDGYVSAKGQNTSSDLRLKDVLGSVTLPLERIAKAPSFEFRWKDGSGESAGSSAQYWKEALPSAVRERGGYLEMQYGNIALISAISIARETMRVDREVTRLREECRRLRRRVARLEGAAGTRHLTAT